MAAALEILKHICLAVPSVQIQLLIGLQLWSEKAGQCLSKLKALQVTQHECLADAFPSISGVKRLQGAAQGETGPSDSSPPG